MKNNAQNPADLCDGRLNRRDKIMKTENETESQPQVGGDDGLGVRSKLVSAGVKNLRQYGYHGCNEDNILTDQIFKAFFATMLRENLGRGYDREISAMLKECGEEA